MGDGDNFNRAGKFAINNEVGIAIKKDSASAVKIRRLQTREPAHGALGSVEFLVEVEGSERALDS